MEKLKYVNKKSHKIKLKYFEILMLKEFFGQVCNSVGALRCGACGVRQRREWQH